MRIAQLDPWALRAQGLDRKLSGAELAVTLGHIAKHRGFRSNSKRERGANAADESSKMLRDISATRDKLAKWRTVGEMFARDEDYAGRKRNRDGDYTRSILRDDQEREVRLLMDIQRRAGSILASVELEEAFIQEAFFQRPLQDSEHLVGPCPFETGEKRAARRSPSFERFRFLSRLNALRVSKGRDERPLTRDEASAAEDLFARHKTYSYIALRKAAGLTAEARFVGVSDADEKKDFVARMGSAAEGTASLRNAIIESAGDVAWLNLIATPEKLDEVAAILTFRDDIGSIGQGLAALNLEPRVLAAIIAGVDGGRAFKEFKGAGHVSAKACRAIIPHLREGLVYSEACAKALYDHSARPQTNLDELNNPVAKKALLEAIKQVRAITQVYGMPGAIHVELARDVGKSKEERDDIRNGMERRNKEKDRLREQFIECVGSEPQGGEDLLRYELWREQNGRSFYSDRPIHPNAIVATDNSIQVDHILPWSRSGEDGYVNKTLCFASENQEKRGQTPYEWFGTDEARWASFVATVEAVRSMKGRKKRNYLLKDAKVLEEKFRPRNLNDTRYACRLLADELSRQYPEDGTRHVFSRPGPLTDRLRRAWGMQNLKKGPDGKRVADDRHHALDALIVAATSEAALQRLTRAFQDAEVHGLHRDFSAFAPPWPGFVREAEEHLSRVFVSRAERRRARGEGHAATIRRYDDQESGPVVYERKAIDGLKLADLGRIKDPERNAKVIEALRSWIEAGKPKGAPPLSPKGDPISKVRLTTTKKVDVLVRDGVAERGEMTRVDVFRKQNRKGAWEFFLVPVYPHQIFDVVDWPKPPNHAVQAYKAESEWPEMGADYEFLWSLFPRCFVEIEKPDGTYIDGYFNGLDRSTGAINVFAHNSKEIIARSIGAKTLKSFQKYAIDRLGNRHEIKRETRTWHGVVCT